MAHLWIKGNSEWEAQKLDGAGAALSSKTADAVGAPNSGATRTKQVRIVCADAGGVRAWALIAPPDAQIRVNGRVPVAGICVLADRDEIRTGDGEHYFFSTESLVALEPFPPQGRAVFCGRCRQPIEEGSPAVRCPGCGVWYNQSDSLPCWLYADKCSICGHPTALDTGFTWVPEA
jgi:hypothetical protein